MLRLLNYSGNHLKKKGWNISKTFYPSDTVVKIQIIMYIDKENLHPNIAHLIRQKRSIDEWSRTSRHHTKQPSQDWRKRVMCPSFREKEIDQKLLKMLNSQKSVKECMQTTLSQEKMVNSFVSSNPNYTLQKYFQEEQSPSIKESSTRKKDMIDILKMVEKIVQKRTDNLEALSEMQLIQLIKGKLSSILPNDAHTRESATS